MSDQRELQLESKASRASAFRLQLRQLLESASAALKKMDDAIAILNAVAPASSVRTPWGSSVAEEVVINWASNILSDFSREHRGITHFALTTNDIDPRFYRIAEIEVDDRSIEEALRLNDITFDEFIELYLERYDFDAFVTLLEEMASKVESWGLKDAAEQLYSLLKMGSRQLGPVRRGRCTLFEMCAYDSFGSYNYDTIEKLGKLASIGPVIEADTGLTGLAQAFNCAYHSLFHHNAVRSSRTNLTPGQAIDILTFKDKFQFKMPHDTAEALIAFVRIHAPDKALAPSAAA
jgi:hypothetical protein